MKRYYFKANFFILAIVGVLFCSDTPADSNPIYSPVYMPYDELSASVSYDPPQTISTVGKVYLYGNYVFVNEIYQGIHVIDQTTPSNPLNIGFIKIPGNVDIAVKGNTLYADSFVDLVAFDITNPASPAEISRIPNMFPYPYDYADVIAEPIIVDHPGAVFDPIDITLGIVIDWIYTGEEIINDIAADSCYGSTVSTDMTASLDTSASNAAGGSTTGTGGSLSRFTIVSTNYLYALNSTDLNIVDITIASNPVFNSSVYIGYDLGSVFADGNNLFISSSPYIYIYNIASPLSPVYVSSYYHDAGCSPVIASGNFMYATTNTANCGNSYNSVQVVDISNLSSPSTTSSYYLTGPFGLGLDLTNNMLAVCDGSSGIRLFPSSVPSLVLTGTVPSPSGDILHDIIISGNNAYVIGETGLHIYDTTGIGAGSMTWLSTVPIVQ